MFASNRFLSLALVATALVGAGCDCAGTATTSSNITIIITPATATLPVGAKQAFSATVTGAKDPGIVWTVDEGDVGGTINSEGAYVAGNTPGVFHVKATSVEAATQTALATVTVTDAAGGISLTLSPGSVTLQTGQTQQFASAVAGSTNTFVNYSIQEGTAGGTITSGGLYTAPSAAGTFHVVAKAEANPLATASATVTVTSAPNISISINPASLTLGGGQTQQFTATVTGTTNTAVTWTVQEVGGGTVTTGGFYTAPATPGAFHVVATSQASPAKTATATITVMPLTVTITPPTALLEIGSTQAFTATVTGSTNTQVTWSIQEGPSCGAVTSAGLYTPPSTPGTCHVVATSAANTAQSATATVTVIDAVTITLVPLTATLTMGQSLQFTATVGGSANQNVTWSVVEGAVGGTVSSTGLYTAPTVVVASTFHVAATPQANPGKAAQATVTVNPGIGVQVTPATVTMTPGGTQTFTATVTGTATTTVTWTVQEGSTGGTVTAAGAYTAPATSGTYHVVASSTADTTKKGFATVIVLGAPVDITGTVTYSGAKTGLVYVILAYDDVSAGLVGTSTTLVSGTATFTLKGVQQRGGFSIRAFVDSLATGMYHQAVDPFGSVPVTVGNSALTGVTVPLADSEWNGWTSFATPSLLRVVPSDESALVAYDPAWDTNGNDECKDYRIYWSDTPNVNGTNNIGSMLITANAPRLAVVRGLTNGQQLYFTMICPDAVLFGGYAAEIGPVTIGQPTGAFTLNGAVTTPAIAGSPTPPLYVVALSGSAGYMTRIASPAGSQAWSMAGVVAGTYHLYAFRDVGGDGKLTPTDPGNFFDPVTVVVTANQTAPTLMLSASSAVATVTTGHVNDSNSHSYGLFLRVRPNLKRPVKAQLTSGPKVSLPIDLPLNETGGARHELSLPLGTTAPATGDTYLVSVVYADGTTDTLTAYVTALLPAPVVTAPAASASSEPTFQWQPLTPSTPISAYFYQLRLYDWSYAGLGTGAQLLGWADDVPSSTTLLLYSDVHPTDATLTSAYLPYWWTLSAVDSYGNWSQTVSSFTVQ